MVNFSTKRDCIRQDKTRLEVFPSNALWYNPLQTLLWTIHVAKRDKLKDKLDRIFTVCLRVFCVAGCSIAWWLRADADATRESIWASTVQHCEWWDSYVAAAAAAAAECDVPCVTREESLKASSASPAVDRLLGCPVACRGFGVVAVESPGKSEANECCSVCGDWWRQLMLMLLLLLLTESKRWLLTPADIPQPRLHQGGSGLPPPPLFQEGMHPHYYTIKWCAVQTW